MGRTISCAMSHSMMTDSMMSGTIFRTIVRPNVDARSHRWPSTEPVALSRSPMYHQLKATGGAMSRPQKMPVWSQMPVRAKFLAPKLWLLRVAVALVNPLNKQYVSMIQMPA